MYSRIIFCPYCHTFLLDAARCTQCGQWERPEETPVERGKLVWETSVPAKIASAVTLVDDLLYVGDDQGMVYALEASTGHQRWQQPASLGEWRLQNQVAVGGGLVVVGPADSRSMPAADKAILAFEAAMGAERWRTPLSVRRISDPLIVGDTIFAATSDGFAVALALADGEVIWREPIGGVYSSAPVLCGDFVLFGGDGGILTARHKGDGKMAWTFQVEPFGDWPEAIPYPPAVNDGSIYFTCWNRRCYALSLSGSLLWVSEPTDKGSPLSAPLVDNDSIYFCARDRFIYCLDRATGKRRWQTRLEERSHVIPALIAGLLCIVVRSGQVLTLDPASGEVIGEPVLTVRGKVETGWAHDDTILYLGDEEGGLYALIVQAGAKTQVETLEQEGKWEEAATEYALRGDLRRAGDIYCQHLSKPNAAAQIYEAAGAMAMAASQHEEAGDLKRARDIYRDLGQHVKVAELSIQMHDNLGAAQAYGAAELWGEAGRCFHLEEKWSQAAISYERAADQSLQAGKTQDAQTWWGYAGQVYEYMDQPEKAIQMYQKAEHRSEATRLLASIRDLAVELSIGRWLFDSKGLASRFEQEGRHIEAAEEYIQAKLFADAGRMYEAVHEYTLAAEQYQAAGDLANAARLLERLNNWEGAALMYRELGDRQRSGDAFARAGAHQYAAADYEIAGAWPQAAAQWEALERWDRAAKAWERGNALVQAAQAWLRAGQPARAGECFWRGAASLEPQGDEDAEPSARLYDLAYQAFLEGRAMERAVQCDARRRYLREQPWLQVELLPPGNLVVGQSHKLVLMMRNKGWGQARDIGFEVPDGPFHIDTMQSIMWQGLAPDVPPAARLLYVVPQQTGDVPLRLNITYKDVRGLPMPLLRCTFDFNVHDRIDALYATPREVHYHGTVIQSGSIGNLAGNDLVSIQRTAAVPDRSGDAAAAPVIVCEYCRQEQSANVFKCSRCGNPFLHCPQCGLAVAASANFCVHCQASLR